MFYAAGENTQSLGPCQSPTHSSQKRLSTICLGLYVVESHSPLCMVYRITDCFGPYFGIVCTIYCALLFPTHAIYMVLIVTGCI